MASTHFYLPILLLLLQLCNALYPTELIYQFPVGTSVENLAVRPDGSILTTIGTAPELYLIQPSSSKPKPRLIHRFDEYGGKNVSGIAEVSPDSYVVAVTRSLGLGQPEPGSTTLWRVTFPTRNSKKADVTFIAQPSQVLVPNGLVALNKNKILLADSANGLVFIFDINAPKPASDYSVFFDPLFQSNGKGGGGVNGLRIRGSTLYFTNTAQNILARVDIDPKTGLPLGLASVIANTLPPTLGYDDFALNSKGEAFVANVAGSFIERIDVQGKQTIIAGSINSTEIAEPTSAAFGRNGNEKILYITTAGGLYFPVQGNKIVGGQVVAIKLGK